MNTDRRRKENTREKKRRKRDRRANDGTQESKRSDSDQRGRSPTRGRSLTRKRARGPTERAKEKDIRKGKINGPGEARKDESKED